MKQPTGTKTSNASLQAFIALAIFSEFAYLAIAALGPLNKAIPEFLALFGAAFLLYWVAATKFFELSSQKENRRPLWSWQLQRMERFSWLHDFIFRKKRKPELKAKHVLMVGVVFGLFFRLTMLYTTTALSDDIYRYIWDGKVAAHGINPFKYAPEANELSELRDDVIYPKVNHKEIPTIYPPVSQLIFKLLAMLSPTVLCFRIGLVFFDLLTAGALCLVLSELKIDAKRMLIYFWNPLMIIEFSGTGHTDVIGVLFLSFSLLYLVKRHLYLATTILVLAFLTKFVAILMLPIIAFMKEDNKLNIPLLFVILTAALYLPYADAGHQLFAGLLVYADKWAFNGSLFALVVHSVDQVAPDWLVTKLMIEPFHMGPTAETLITRRYDMALWLAKGLAGITLLGLFYRFLKRLNSDIKGNGPVWIFTLGLIIWGVFTAWNPTVYPWYLAWLLPFLVVWPNRAWILFTGLSMLSYSVVMQYIETGLWQESVVVLLLEYVPFYCLLIFDYVRQRLAVKNSSTRLRLEYQ